MLDFPERFLPGDLTVKARGELDSGDEAFAVLVVVHFIDLFFQNDVST